MNHYNLLRVDPSTANRGLQVRFGDLQTRHSRQVSGGRSGAWGEGSKDVATHGVSMVMGDPRWLDGCFNGMMNADFAENPIDMNGL